MHPKSGNLESTEAVRRLVARTLGFTLPTGPAGRKLTRALVICQHLETGQHEAAIVAHDDLVRLVRADLGSLGTADVEYLQLANALADYLTGAGFVWSEGRWAPDPSTPLERGPQLVESG
jgi:hypothetical protein